MEFSSTSLPSTLLDTLAENQITSGVKTVLEAIQKLDPGQQITVLRNAVVDMGFICEVLPDSSKQLKIIGKVQTPWFGVQVGMNIAWRFLLNPQGQIFFLAIDMLASPQELLNLRPN